MDSGPYVVHDEPCPMIGDYTVSGRGTRVDTPYDAAFVEALKDRWPYGKRYWVPDEEIWWIVEGHEAEIEELVMEHFGGCVVVDEDGNEVVRDPSGDYEQGGLW